MTTVSEAEAAADLMKKPEELLKELYALRHHNVGQTLLMRDTIKALAISSCIWIQMNRAAEAQSKLIIRLTRWLIVLTLALFIAGVAETVGRFFAR